jgi:ATP-dependent Lon protease
MRKAALKVVSRNGDAKQLVLAPESVEEYLGPPRVFSESLEAITESGIATGLAWTPVGGEILFIEATRMPGKGHLILTGSLGEVMKESAQAASSYLRSQSHALGIDLSNYDKYDLHIHVPSGATPKDGPSAGVTIVVALASLLTQRKVRTDMAMTGEISLRGRILRVGGIKEKVLAARRAGIRHVILPRDNETDLRDLPDKVRQEMQFTLADRIEDVLQAALPKVGQRLELVEGHY